MLQRRIYGNNYVHSGLESRCFLTVHYSKAAGEVLVWETGLGSAQNTVVSPPIFVKEYTWLFHDHRCPGHLFCLSSKSFLFHVVWIPFSKTDLAQLHTNVLWTQKNKMLMLFNLLES